MTDVKNEFVINLSIDGEEIQSAMESVLRGVVKSMDESSERDQARKVLAIKALAREYGNFLASLPIPSRRCLGEATALDGVKMPHARWMCDEIATCETNSNLNQVEKLNRWLGFVQGVLWSCKLKTINNLREDVTRVRL